MAQNELWNVAREKMLEERDALPEEDGNQLREYKALHEENFISSWLRENVEGGEAEMQEWRKEAGEDANEHAKRKVEGEERENGDQEKVCESDLQ